MAAQSILTAAAVVMILLTASGFAAAHFFDHTAHSDGLVLPAGPLPLCDGSAADNESTKE